jgi:hypothetical protein
MTDEERAAYFRANPRVRRGGGEEGRGSGGQSEGQGGRGRGLRVGVRMDSGPTYALLALL